MHYGDKMVRIRIRCTNKHKQNLFLKMPYIFLNAIFRVAACCYQAQHCNICGDLKLLIKVSSALFAYDTRIQRGVKIRCSILLLISTGAQCPHPAMLYNSCRFPRDKTLFLSDAQNDYYFISSILICCLRYRYIISRDNFWHINKSLKLIVLLSRKVFEGAKWKVNDMYYAQTL